jgi:hypothetical protein
MVTLNTAEVGPAKIVTMLGTEDFGRITRHQAHRQIRHERCRKFRTEPALANVLHHPSRACAGSSTVRFVFFAVLNDD